MNVSYRWLQSLVPGLSASPAELSEQLAMLGAPVDEVVDLGAEIGDVVIARVDGVRQHPNADRLRVCTVVAGGAEPLQVVCGAPNVEAGGFYPFAPVGARLPGGMLIRKAKLRGEVSEGMLCSARELELGRDHAGLMTLHGEWEPGTPLVPALGLDDARLVVDVTPNRPDLLSHLGIAREVAPAGVADVVLPPLPGAVETEWSIRTAETRGETGGVPVRIEDPSGCPRYLGAVLRGVRVGPSPEWLATRLRAIGAHPINNVVDATNYVQFELGQPLHAFDLGLLRGPEVCIRRARAGETLRTLDGVERALAPEDVVIGDAERAVALGGIMGGENTEVSSATTDLFIECARFDPRGIRHTSRRLGLSTDGAYRHERGIDPELQPLALRRVVELILATAGGRLEGPALDLDPNPFQRPVVELRPERVERLLGVPLSRDEIGDLLRPIGFEVDAASTPLRVQVPGFRPDVTREADLIEEIARRRGYETFSDVLRPFRPGTAPEDPGVAVQRLMQALFARWGFLEARTPAFAPSAEDRVPLLHPLSAEESHLRTSLVPGLLRRVEHNFAHGVRDVRLWEVGTVFFPGESDGRPREEMRVAAVFTGARRPPHWSEPTPAWDAWDLKGLLEEMARELGGRVEAGRLSPLGERVREGTGWVLATPAGEASGGGGEARAVDAPAWAEAIWVLEARLPEANEAREPRRFQALPVHPASDRDLALLVPAGVSAAAVRGVMEEAAGETLETLRAFDVYTGTGIPGGFFSLAWRLRFRSAERTLTDGEVDAAIDRVLKALEERLGVRRR